jgi:hypothetical protein
VNHAATLTQGNGAAIAPILATASAAIAVAIARDWHTTAFLKLSIAVSLVFWVFGQGLGGVFTGQATDVNTGPLLILLSVLLLGATKIRQLPQAHTHDNLT